MKYQYVMERENYEDLAAGRVLISHGGATSFPVRLASEIFQRCAAQLQLDRLRLYDPCCGSGYLLTILGFLHGDQIKSLHGSDVDAAAVSIASSNLGLLTQVGLGQRRQAIAQMAHDYGKQSHQDALQSADMLRRQLPQQAINTGAWVADAAQRTICQGCVDLLIADLPYGQLVTWAGTAADPAYALLEAQYLVLGPGGLAAIISDKKQKPAHPGYERLLNDTLGKRRITILQKT
ncbi:hypothetical protein G4Y79_03735 [Phototrophicus methaneseepsis]|uniref:rRNA methyltransferase AviRa n=1 Tax=Phototrophicus methaneseepsis TaxID=2710758 RepID=A0A7S8IEC2_9CHLR|nr:hypothetical protein [Phototrophicus methaneseepsis]QPC83505.1 hypothetical protein G4Y79_03735 [Phototrophicus methaneseepsis]